METRPQSIVNFERCYLGAFAIGLVNTALTWSETKATFDASPSAEMIGGSFLPIVTAIGFVISLLFWYFIARRGSTVAKWILTVFFVLGLIGTLFAVIGGTYPSGISGVIGVVTTILQGVAISFLFRDDAKPWFGETVAHGV